MIPGMGAVATTLIAGVEAVRRGLASRSVRLTQMGTIRLGKRTEERSPLDQGLRAARWLDDIVFAGWDIFPDDVYVAAKPRSVLDRDKLEQIRPFLEMHRADARRVRPALRQAPRRQEGARPARTSATSRTRSARTSPSSRPKTDRLVMIWCGSTEIFIEPGAVHRHSTRSRRAIDDDDPKIAPSMLYAYAALKEGVPFANGAPNLTVDIPALRELSHEDERADLRQGLQDRPDVDQDRARADASRRACSASPGWYSTNILGNRDGEVLDDPENFKTKEESKLGVLEHILQPELYPDLYGDIYHKVRINYYPPRGDNKEGWDNIDIFGWLGYPMQIKVDFLCRDSILAAPLALDLVPLHGPRGPDAGLRGRASRSG